MDQGQTARGRRLLVTGASGFLGWSVCHVRQRDWDLIGTANSRTHPIPGVPTLKLDLTDARALRAVFAEARPDAVLHLAAMADPNACQQAPEASRRINLDAGLLLAELCGAAEIPCVLTSTDLVFDGTQAPYSEAATPSPVNLYGEHKLMAEIEMRQRCPGLIVCRMPLMYGQPGPGGRNFMGSLAAALREGREVRLFVDEFRSVVCASDAAAGLFLALDKRPALLHLGGRERVSRYEFGALLAACLGADPRLLVPSHQADVSMPAARPPDVSLDSSRAFGLGYDPAPVRESLSRLLAAPAGR